jgi:hypothetical protein
METMDTHTMGIEVAADHSRSEQRLVQGDTTGHFLSPDPVLPEQLSGRTPGSAHPASGVRALMEAILEDAISCVQKQALTPSRRHARLAREAEQWISADNTTWVFSFLNVCAALGLEPDYLRTRLDQWVKRWARPTRQVSSAPYIPNTFKIAA